MALYATKTLTGVRAYLDFLNGTKVASGAPQPDAGTGTGLTAAAASADVSGANDAFADVEVGDRFYISGVATEFVVSVKADDENLTLDDVAGVTLAGDIGKWQARRGARIEPSSIHETDIEGSNGPIYRVTYTVVDF